MNPQEQGGTAQKIVWIMGKKRKETQQINNMSVITPDW